MKSGKKISTPHFDKVQPQLCINAKLRKLHRIMNSLYQPALNPFGLKGSMLSIMFVIGKMKEINQKTLASMLILDPSTMSRDLKKLESRELVKVERGEDLRNSKLSLSKKGYELIEEVSPVWLTIHEKVTRFIGEYQLQVIDQLTLAVQSNLGQLKAKKSTK